MMWFGQRKPRRFEHRMIYADDRKRFVEDLERRARGECVDGRENHGVTDFRSAFTGNTPHINRRRSGSGGNLMFIAIALVALVVAILYLVS
ncbi:hypothetical protein [Prevotella koreensis]|uniref:Uncharacterized protein n=1 Tax=Prevotella koreensis TaxID=2490854 RepID=A0A3S0WL99_9BACT|nr:hypothetical protein [Prevotella koreensis]RUL60074.1 hypothetical protein EHV08_10190 [Prevotella koreensis]